MLNNTYYVISAVTIAALVYSVLRYNVFGGVPWEQLPLYIVNKAVSFSGIILLTLSIILNKRSESGSKLLAILKDSKSAFAGIGFLYIFVHVLLSLILLNPLNYIKLYDAAGMFNLAGGISLTAGALTFAAFAEIFYSIESESCRRAGLRAFVFSMPVKAAVTLLLLTHLFCMGFQGWLAPDKWPGGLPPITLISFVIYLTGVIVNLKLNRNRL
ncbi:MAG: hypothetical protein IAE90_09090 [Ignavibacteria bacterium]|nr:hypothetical protein [Ignavibacteria bacterium]